MDFFKRYSGLVIRVSDSGKSDKVILLLHGYQVNIEIWASFTNKLVKNGYRVISLDFPGHGFSGTKEVNTMEFMADIAVECMNDLKVENAVLVGHSMGGYISLMLAEKYPEKVNGICMMNATPNNDNPDKVLNREKEIKLIRSGKLEGSIIDGMGRMFAKRNRSKMEEMIGDLSASALMSDPQGLVATLEGLMQRKDMNTFIQKYDKPCMFIFGDQDNRITDEIRNKLIEENPNKEYHVLEGTGHATFLEEEDKTVEILTKFIDKIY